MSDNGALQLCFPTCRHEDAYSQAFSMQSTLRKDMIVSKQIKASYNFVCKEKRSRKV